MQASRIGSLLMSNSCMKLIGEYVRIILAGDCTKCQAYSEQRNSVAKKRTRERKTSRTSVRGGASEGKVINTKNMHHCKQSISVRSASAVQAKSASQECKTRVLGMGFEGTRRGVVARHRCETAVHDK